MAMCAYRYVLNKHVIGWGGGEARIQEFIIEKRPVLVMGRGITYVPSGSRAAPKRGGARTESSWSFWEWGIWGAYDHNDYMKRRNFRTFSTGSAGLSLCLSLCLSISPTLSRLYRGAWCLKLMIIMTTWIMKIKKRVWTFSTSSAAVPSSWTYFLPLSPFLSLFLSVSAF